MVAILVIALAQCVSGVYMHCWTAGIKVGLQPSSDLVQHSAAAPCSGGTVEHVENSL